MEVTALYRRPDRSQWKRPHIQAAKERGVVVVCSAFVRIIKIVFMNKITVYQICTHAVQIVRIA